MSQVTVHPSLQFIADKFGTIALADGRCVVLAQQAYHDNAADGSAAWFASGYLGTEDAEDETGPTVKVRWDSIGAEEAEDDADWGSPADITHYSEGDLVAA